MSSSGLRLYDPDLPSYREARQVLVEPDPRPIGQRLTAAALGLVIVALLTLYGLATITSRPVAIRILARAVPSITEVDRLISLHGDELRAQAQTAAGLNLSLPGFPLAVTLTPEDVRTNSPQALQSLLDQRAAAALYDHGAGAFSAAGGAGVDETGPLFSAPWTIHETFSLFNGRRHHRFQQLTLVAAALAGLLVLLFCLQVGSYGRIVGLGAILLSAALLIGVLTFILWLIVQFYATSATTPLGIGGWGVLADASWTMVLIDAVAALTGLCLLLVGLLFAALARLPVETRPRAASRFAPQLDRRRRRPME